MVHLIFNNFEEQLLVMNISNTFPPPYNKKNSGLSDNACSFRSCTNHVEYLGNYYPIYYRRKIIEKRRTLYTKSNWEQTIIPFLVKSSVKFDHYVEYPILFDYDGNVRIDKFYLEKTRQEYGENIVSYRVSNFN